MKSNLFILCFSVITSSLNSIAQNQEVNQWNTDGNIVTEENFIGSQNDYPLKFKCNNIERLRISPDGKVGIGICTPNAKLDVSGSVLFRNSFNLTGLPNSSLINNQILVIDSLGTVYKSTLSEIANSLYASKYCDEGPISNPTWSNGENKIFGACPQVNVGINTDNPRVNLDVIGTTYSNSLKIGSVDPINSNVRFHMKTNASINSTADQFLIESTQQELLKLNYQGLLTSRSQIIDVGNSTSTPFIIKNSTQKLLQVDNSGILHSKRIKVDADSWADFVFDDDYNLLSFSDLKKYIEVNNHLPSIPSEQQVLNNGIDILDMNILLLQKIEELTLYILELENRVKIMEQNQTEK
jgi:hypothetical protein